MAAIKEFIRSHTVPRHLSPQDGIQYWQERILMTLLLVGSVLGIMAWIPSVYLSVKESLFEIAVADTIVLTLFILLFLNPDMPFRIRGGTVAAISYTLGLILTFTLGPFGAGPVWLFFFPILTGVLLGPRASVWALVLNAFACLVIGYLILQRQTELPAQFGFKVWHIAEENPEMKWIVISLNFMLLNILSTVLVSVMLNGINTSLVGLSASEKKYRRIFENILDVYFETSMEGTILEISPSVEKVSAYTQKELVGEPITRIYNTPETRPSIIGILIEQDQVNGFEMDLVDKNGRARTCSINARLIRDEHGQPERILGIFRDVSEQKAVALRKKELEERLNRSQKMEALGLLAGGVAHDLNNVLSGVVTYPDLLLMDVERNSPLAKGLDTIKSSGLRATEIVQDLLTLSRRGVVTRKVLDLNEIIRDFLRTPEYGKILSFHPHVRVETDISARSSCIKGSPVHLQKTVMNLVSNAAEAQLSGGKILISTANRNLDKPVSGYDRVLAGDYLVLSVSDQGEGISPEDLKRIFEPFFTKKVMGRSGTGLGMAVVWGTVQDHDGYIDVTSSPGRGTRFDLYFPVTAELPDTAHDQIDMNTLMGKGERILIVDDVPHQRQIAETALSRLGYETISADSGEAAVELLKTRDADLILLDMIMDPGIDGLETYRRIKAFKPHQRAVIASGFSKTRKVKDTIALGAGQYLKKPYTLEAIGLAVKMALSRETDGNGIQD